MGKGGGGGGQQEIPMGPMEEQQFAKSAELVNLSNTHLPGVRENYKNLVTADRSQTLGNMASVDARMTAGGSSPINNGRLDPMGAFNRSMATGAGIGAGVTGAQNTARDRQIKGYQGLMDSANTQTVNNLSGLGKLAQSNAEQAANAASAAQKLSASRAQSLGQLGQTAVGSYHTYNMRTDPAYRARFQY